MPSGVFLWHGLFGEIRPKGVPFSGFRYAGKGRDFNTNEKQKIRLEKGLTNALFLAKTFWFCNFCDGVFTAV